MADESYVQVNDPGAGGATPGKKLATFEFTNEDSDVVEAEAVVIVDADGEQMRGARVAAESLPVVLASDQAAISIAALPSGVNNIGDVDVLTLPAIGQLPSALVGGRLDENVGSWMGSAAPTVGQKTMSNSLPVAIASDQGAITVGDGGSSLTVDGSLTVDDGAGSLTVDTPQLPSALVGGRLDNNIGSWFGSTAPTLGQKLPTSSIPVVLSTGASIVATLSQVVANVGSAVPPTQGIQIATPAVGSSNLEAPKSFDVDSGGGTQFVLGTNLRRSASGGSQELLGQGSMAQSLPVTIASDQTGMVEASTSVSDNITTAGDSVSLAIAGYRSIGFLLNNQTPGGFIGTVEVAADVVTGTQDGQGYFYVRSETVDTGLTDNTKVSSIALTGAVTRIHGTLLIPAGATKVYIVCSNYTSGTLAVIITANSTDGDQSMSQSGIDGALPPSADVMGASDGTNVQVPRVFDVDTGAGKQFVLGASLRRSASGGSQELLGQSTMALSLPVAIASDQGAVPVSDGGGSFTVDDGGGSISIDDSAGSLTVDTPQLPSGLVGGRLDANVGAWFGSTAPTVGQKAMASSVPVAIANDQGAVPVSDTTSSSLANGVQTAVSSAAVSVLAANANRRGAIIQNTGQANVRVGVTGVTASTGVQLYPGQAIQFNPPHIVTNEIFAIREGTADSTVLAMEMT